MFNVVDGPRLFRLRVTDPNAIVELLVNGDVNEFVDGGGDDRATVLAIEDGQVAAAPDETHAQGCLADNHSGSRVISFQPKTPEKPWQGGFGEPRRHGGTEKKGE